MSVFLYRFPLRVQLHLQDRGVANMSRPFVDNDFKVYKGAQTDIDFYVRNNDRKPITLSGKNAYVIIRDNRSKREVLKKELRFIDEMRAHLQLNLFPAEIEDWEEGYYDYVVLIEHMDSSQSVLFTSQNQDARGWFELKGDVLPSLSQSYDLNPAEFVPFQYEDNTGTTTRYVSTALPGDAALGFKDGLQTFAVYVKEFSGRVWVQGSLEESPGVSYNDWFPIHVTPNTFEITFYEHSGIEPFNFQSNVKWIRFVYEKDFFNEGDITRILYKP